MNLLITGAFQISESEKHMISGLGFDIDYLENELVEHNLDFKKYDGVICNGLFLHNDIRKFSRLKFVQVTSAGLDRLPMEYIEQKNITVYSAKDVYSIPIAEWVILKILEIFKQSKFFIVNQESRKWVKNRNIEELHTKTALILGYGSIGKQVAKRISAFGVKTIGVGLKEKVNDDNLNEYYTIHKLNHLLGRSDIIIILLPLNESTKHFINFSRMSKMKNDSILINVSRGEIINEVDLIKMLDKNKFRGCALDVFDEEPLCMNSKLWKYENVHITPHNAFVSLGNKERLIKLIYTNLKGEIDE